MIDIDVEKIKTMYCVDGMSQQEIAVYLGVSQWSISQRMKKFGIATQSKTRNLGKKIYQVNDSFLDVITKKNAWTLGWILADGWIDKKNSFGIKVSEKDRDVLEKIRDILSYSGPILESSTTLKKTNKTYKSCILKINSKQIRNQLIAFDITNNKTLKEIYPSILREYSEDINRNFIKGVFEGDGSIILSKTKKVTFQIVGTLELLSSIQEYLIKFVNVNKTKIAKNGNSKNNHYALRYHGKIQGQKIFDWIYKDSECHLNRKYNKYLEMKGTT